MYFENRIPGYSNSDGSQPDDDFDYPEPECYDGVKSCPDCERPNQFGELCSECREERATMEDHEF